MSKKKSSPKDRQIHKDVFQIFRGHQQDTFDILLQSKTRKGAVVPTTGGEDHSPVAVSADRLVGAALGCPKGEGFGIVSTPGRLRR